VDDNIQDHNEGMGLLRGLSIQVPLKRLANSIQLHAPNKTLAFKDVSPSLSHAANCFSSKQDQLQKEAR